MKRLLVLLLLTYSAFAQSPATVTGAVQDAGGSPATSGTVVFTLQPTNQGVQYFVSGTATIAPQSVTCGIDGSGNVKNLALSGPCTVYGVDVITPANLTYTVQFYPNGVSTAANTVAQECITGSSYNLNIPRFCPVIKVTPQSATVITNPVQSNLIPGSAHVFSLGSSALPYASLYVDNIFSTLGSMTLGSLTTTGNATVQGNLSVTGTSNLTGALTETGTAQFNSTVTTKIFNKIRVVDGTNFTTVQAAITDACTASPVAPVYIPAGTFAQNGVFTFCDHLHVHAAGKGQADGTGCSTTITTTQTSGNLLDITGFNDVELEGFCVKNTAIAGADTALKLSSTQRANIHDLYISGPFAHQIQFKSSLLATSSTIWNDLKNIHTTGTAIGGDGCLFDASDAVLKVINNNYLENVTCTGGVGGFGFRTTSTTATPVINENEIHSGEITATGGAAMSIGANTVRDLLCQNCNLEGSTTGVTIGAGNTGKFDSSNISANGGNTLAENVNNSSASFIFINNNIGGATYRFQVDPSGNTKVNSLCFGSVTCDPGNINIPSGQVLEASGTSLLSFNTTFFEVTKNLTLDKLINSYNGISTVGNGASVSYGQDDKTGQSASIGSFTLITGTATSGGHYQVCYQLATTATDASGAGVTLTVGWTSDTIARTNVSSSVATAATTNGTAVCLPLNSDNSVNITYLTTVTGVPTTGRYSVHIWAVKQ